MCFVVVVVVVVAVVVVVVVAVVVIVVVVVVVVVVAVVVVGCVVVGCCCCCFWAALWFSLHLIKRINQMADNSASGFESSLAPFILPHQIAREAIIPIGPPPAGYYSRSQSHTYAFDFDFNGFEQNSKIRKTAYVPKNVQHHYFLKFHNGYQHQSTHQLLT